MLAPDKVWEIPPQGPFHGFRKLAFVGYHSIVVFFGAIFAGFSPCVSFSEAGWDTYPTPEEKAVHKGNSGEHRSTDSVR